MWFYSILTMYNIYFYVLYIIYIIILKWAEDFLNRFSNSSSLGLVIIIILENLWPVVQNLVNKLLEEEYITYNPLKRLIDFTDKSFSSQINYVNKKSSSLKSTSHKNLDKNLIHMKYLGLTRILISIKLNKHTELTQSNIILK